MLASADPFSVDPGDVLQNVFQAQPCDLLVSGYAFVNADIPVLLVSRAGQTLRLRFAEVDNQLTFNFGVDAVSLDTTTAAAGNAPEPTSLALLILSGLPLARAIIHRRRSG